MSATLLVPLKINNNCTRYFETFNKLGSSILIYFSYWINLWQKRKLQIQEKIFYKVVQYSIRNHLKIINEPNNSHKKGGVLSIDLEQSFENQTFFVYDGGCGLRLHPINNGFLKLRVAMTVSSF